LPGAVFGVSEWLLFSFATRPVTAGEANLSALGRSSALIDVFNATMLLLCVCLGIAFYFLVVARKSGALILVWLVASVGLYFWMRSSTDPLNRAWRLLGDPPKVCPGAPLSGGTATGCGTDLVNFILDWATPFLAIASVAAILGAISCLAYS